MSPQWMPQNIQKRLLLYVLQQLSLFSEIDLPNLEEVSLNNIVLKNVSIDPEKVGKLPGCNLRYGQVGSLELNGGVMGGVNIDANNVEIVIVPDFDVKEEIGNNVQFLLAQSTADLASTLMMDKLSSDMESSGDEDETIKPPTTSKSRSNSSSSGTSTKSKPSALGGVMTRAVEIALLRLQVKVTNLDIKIVSESTDLVIKIDETLFNTINGTRHIKIKGIQLVTLKPEVNPGESSNQNPEHESPTETDDESISDDDDDNDNDYGEESLMDSMVFTHDEASSIYMSATSQSFNKPKVNDNNILKEAVQENKKLPILAYIDDIEIEFEGLSNITNLEIDVGEVKLSSIPITPTIMTIFSNISHNLKLKHYQQRKQNIHKQRFRSNLSFPQYADDNDEIENDPEQMPILEDDNSAPLDPFFDRLRINKITISATSSLLPTGKFASASNSLNFVVHNLNVKCKNETLIYGGIEVFKIVKITNDQEIDILKFNNSPLSSNSESKSMAETIESTSPTASSSKADIRFELFTKSENETKHIEFTVLFSKQTLVNLDMPVLLLLLNFGRTISSIYDSFNSMKSTMASIDSYKNRPAINRDINDSSTNTTKETSFQFILQTASTTINLKISQTLDLKAVVFPISFNLLKNNMSINTILISNVSNGTETLISTISNIQLVTKLQNFKSFVNRSGYTNGTNDSFPHEITLGSTLSLSLSNMTSNVSLTELKTLIKEISGITSALESLPLQVNSLENSVKDKEMVFNNKSNKNESSAIFQNSIYSTQRRPRRPTFNNPSLVNKSRSNVASFRLYVDHFEVHITNVLPKLGDFDFHLENISFYKLNNDVQGTVHAINVDRNLENSEEANRFIYEFQRKKFSDINIPLILINIKSNEKINTIDITLRNLLIEYFTSWLELLEKEIDENAVLHDITDQKQETKSKFNYSSQKRLDIRFSLHDCVLGLNPGRLNCKSFLIVNKGNSDVTSGLHQFYIKSSLRNLSLLIIDDVKNVSESDEVRASKLSNSGYVSPLSWFLSCGYISVGTINCTHLGITVNTGIQEMMKKNENLGIQDNLSLLDIKINSDEHQLDLCADSAHVLIQMINDLKPPLGFIDEEKIRISLKDHINLLNDISEDEFINKSNINSPNICVNLEDIVKISKRNENDSSNTNDINIIDEYYDDLRASSQSLDNGFNKLSLIESNNDKGEECSFVFDEEHFSNTSDNHRNNEVCPIKLNINLSKTKIYLYDGFDWKGTRKTIKGAVRRVEAQALQELENKKELKTKEQLKRNIQVKFEEPHKTPQRINDESEVVEADEDGDDYDDDEFENQLLIGETLFQSIHLSLPKGSDPSRLTKNINKSVQNGHEDPKDLNINYNIETGRSYKNLKLRRSKSHKVSIDLKNIEVNLTIMTTRDPRIDKEVPDIPYEVINSIDLRIEDVDIYDNIPNSTWNKFLSYMNSLGEKEIGTSMIKASIINVRPDPELCSTEAVIDLAILPIRLHIDQDALDFFIRFFEFKDKRFELPIDEIIYIQRFKMSSLKLKLDYKPKKIDYSGIRSGKVSEFVNFFILDGSELNLPKLKLYGLLGMPMLGTELTRAWTPNIQQTQLTGLLAGLSPFRSIVNIGGGLKDLIAVPIKEYQKDGRLIRSLQKGTSKFAKTTGYELLNLGAKLASGTQVILEQSEEAFGGEGSCSRSPKNKFDKQDKSKEDEEDEDFHTISKNNNGTRNLLASSQLLNKSVAVDDDPYGNKKLYSYIELDEGDDIDDKILENSLLLMHPKDLKKSREHLQDDNKERAFQAFDDKEELDDEDAIKLVSLYSNQPENTLQGLKLAYKSLGENFKITKNAIKNLRRDVNASPNVQESLKSMLKSSPVLIIRPMIGTTEALLKTLMGISNEIDSNQIIESKDKYRYDNASQR